MDLVEFREDVFSRLEADFSELAAALGIPSFQCVPVSALDGDNIVARSENTPWYSGPTLLEHLESVPVRAPVEMETVRFPVQYVIRPDATFRGFAGRVASGRLRPGDELLALPSKQTSRVESIVSFDGDLGAAGPGQSVVLKLADEIDLSRGDLLVPSNAVPHVSNRFSAMVVWLHATRLELGRSYLAKHLGRQVKIKVARIRHRVDVNTLAEHAADHLEMNEIALAEFETSHPLYFDAYRQNRATGSLILIEPLTNATVGAVMIREPLSSDEVLHGESLDPVTLEVRIQRRGHCPAIFALSGDRAVAEALERNLAQRRFETVLVNHDEIPSAARRPLFTTLWNLGLVVISWSANRLGPRGKSLFADIAGKSFFVFSAEDSEILTDTIRLADTLRTGGSHISGGGI